MSGAQLHLITSPAPKPQGAAFDDFWLLWPRRVARKDAMKAWHRLTPSQQTKALDALVDWRTIFAQRDEDKVPHPATWLNGERWEDELPREYRQQAARQSEQQERRQEGETTARQPRPPMTERVKALLDMLKGKR